MQHQYTNDLINETSPYLLQHAHNPVDWKPWKPEVLEQAKRENKPLLISVGYAACHWCHVMEHESFEDSTVAAMMNEKFINIKVDREERPDVDQVYMNAVQLMTGGGGWPMNVVALPDGRPFWGGTYFPKDKWIQSLEQVHQVFIQDPKKVEEYADKLAKGMQNLDMVVPNTEEASFTKEDLKNSIESWSRYFDKGMGGMNRAPKFMMPNNQQFLLRYAFQAEDEKLMEYVDLTLTKMAYGGVFDHVGGGFSRYAVDTKWHVPHFEKMLYDNGQLASLYAEAYTATKNPLYKNVVYDILAFVERELTNEQGGFYSSLDADSLDEEGHLEEGAFYVWKKETLQKLLKDDFDLFKDYYNINDYGLWEKGNYVLIRKDSDENLLATYQISAEQLKTKVIQWKKILLDERSKRARPRLDDKTLTSWNALMLKGYVDAYKAFDEQHFLDIALANANFIVAHQMQEDGGLNHSYKDGKSTINGYLEDYAATIEAFLALYEVTLDEQWLDFSKKFADYCFDHFHDERSQLFFFTSNEDASLVTRSMEKTDNVISASNSIMAKNLFKLSHYFGDKRYFETSQQMLNNMKGDINTYPSSHANWLDLMINFAGNYYEVAVVGEDAKEKINALNKNYIPNKMIVGSEDSSKIPLLENRFVAGETYIYVCVNSACKLPTTEVKTAIEQMDPKL
ncbi:thioredoxin domain-containing protein [Sungkyunkwania multivorans]|uniref:Thioredoxin domain-containing protein n=2 Tax=Sungkyunkwania multivorans TaxID=1173618 RepID=A0ABW3D0N0_9FLAO